jgi:hypothetical protein
MRNLKVINLAVMFILMVSAVTASAGRMHTDTRPVYGNQVSTDTRPVADCSYSDTVRQGLGLLAALDQFPLEEVSEQEQADLLYMLEEEKLARDVYVAMGELWTSRIFANIAFSEQSHMNAVLLLMDRYEITSELDVTGNGVFLSDEMQALYGELISAGSDSLAAALAVGAMIEELDIVDLQERITATDNQDIAFVYNNLLEGSKRHLRAFYSQLTLLGETYSPQYISQELFDEITAVVPAGRRVIRR